jgi:hypothetical protein
MMFTQLQEEAELANAKVSQAEMELETMREELEQQRQQSSEKVARLQKEVDLVKQQKDGEVAGIVAVSSDLGIMPAVAHASRVC